MAWYRIAENVLTSMANAINAKTGKTAPLTPVEMVAEIQDMPSGGGYSFGWASTAEIVTVGANSVTNSTQAIQYFSNYAPDLVILLSPMTRINQMVWMTSTTDTTFGRANSSLKQIDLRTVSDKYDAYLVEGSQYLVLKA